MSTSIVEIVDLINTKFKCEFKDKRMNLRTFGRVGGLLKNQPIILKTRSCQEDNFSCQNGSEHTNYVRTEQTVPLKHNHSSADSIYRFWLTAVFVIIFKLASAWVNLSMPNCVCGPDEF